jgi:hypothetical protein
MRRKYALASVAGMMALVLGCSSSSDSGGKVTPQGVQSWTCCALGQSGSVCTCYEDTPNSATGCSPSVSACSSVDGGAGCCVASLDGDAWQCECAAPGAACPTATGSNAQQVDHCPP